MTLPWALLGVAFDVADPLTRWFLVLTLTPWIAAGAFALVYLRRDLRRRSFAAFFVLAFVGNVGAVIAADVATFYTFFAVMTYAAYPLVVHTRSPDAIRAGRVYLAMAIGGEALLLGGIFVLLGGRTNLALDAVPAVVAESPHRTLLVACFLAGFGVKAGLAPLHVWLPLAHPVAPTPASAVLSGSMIAAGLLGWLRFLPLGTVALPGLGTSLAGLGLLAAFAGGLIGATQREAKTALAYSSVSQMGMMVVGVGAALAAPSFVDVLRQAIAFFALHHALAKSALFLGVAVAAETRGGPSAYVVRLGLLLPALAIAGAPLSSGALAKHGLVAALAPWEHGGSVALLLAMAAIGSTLVTARAVALVWPKADGAPSRPRAGLAIPFALLVGSGPALLVRGPHEAASLLGLEELVKGAWPLALGLVLAVTVAFAGRGRAWSTRSIPAGDLLVPFAALVSAAHRARPRVHRERPARTVSARGRARVRGIARAITRADVFLTRFETVGAWLLVLSIVLLAALLAP